jgi:hypothetical protein
MPCISCMFQKNNYPYKAFKAYKKNILNTLYALYVSKK